MKNKRLIVQDLKERLLNALDLIPEDEEGSKESIMEYVRHPPKGEDVSVLLKVSKVVSGMIDKIITDYECTKKEV